MPMKDNAEKILSDMVVALGDRFTHYAIVCMDADKFYTRYDSCVVAEAMAKELKRQAQAAYWPAIIPRRDSRRGERACLRVGAKYMILNDEPA